MRRSGILRASFHRTLRRRFRNDPGGPMRRRTLAVALVGALWAAGLATPAQAEPVVLTPGTWFDFAFGGVGTSWRESFRLTTSRRVTLTVTDLFLSGDQFFVTLTGPGSGGFIGFPTSLPGSVG